MASASSTNRNDQRLLGKLSTADREILEELYKTHPRLCPHFKNITDFLNQLHEDSTAFNDTALLHSLMKVAQLSAKWTMDAGVVARFAAVIGFVEQTADVVHQIMRNRGMGYLIEFKRPYPQSENDLALVVLLRFCFQHFSCDCAEIRPRLLQAGILRCVLEDIRHLQYKTGQALNDGEVYGCALGTIHNCCKSPQMIPTLREMGLTDLLRPFLTKEHLYVRSIAMLTLRYVVENMQVDMMQLDSDILQYYLDILQAHIVKGLQADEGQALNMEEILSGLSDFAKNDRNKHLIVAKGATKQLVSVLQTDFVEEQQEAMATLIELSKDPDNIKIFERDGNLKTALANLEACENQTIQQTATHLLSLIRQKQGHDSAEDTYSPLVEDLLEECINIMAILEIGEVEYVLDQLSPTCAPESSGGASNGQFLSVLADLAKTEDRRREILARGGLAVLETQLQRGTEEDQQEALRILQQLATNTAYKSIIRSHGGVMQMMHSLSSSRCPALAQAAHNTQHAINQEMD